MTNLEAELKALEIGDEWTNIPDFYFLVQKVTFKAATTAICGPHLLRMNPTFTEDFWDFDSRITGLFKTLPRWLIPKSYAIRDKLTKNIAEWHAYAKDHFDWEDDKVEKEEWEEFYGSKLMRERARAFAEVDGLNDEGRAANDLGMIWGSVLSRRLFLARH